MMKALVQSALTIAFYPKAVISNADRKEFSSLLWGGALKLLKETSQTGADCVDECWESVRQACSDVPWGCPQAGKQLHVLCSADGPGCSTRIPSRQI